MTAKQKSADAEVVMLKPIKVKQIEIKVVGDSSLILHKWSQKAIQMILDKQGKRQAGAGRRGTRSRNL
jgi:hypothetical protein